MKELELKVKKFNNGEVWSLFRDNKEILLSEEGIRLLKDVHHSIGQNYFRNKDLDTVSRINLHKTMDEIWNKHFPKEIPTLKFGDKVKSGDGTLGVVILKGRAPYTREVSYDIAFDNGLTVTYKESELNQLTIIK